MQFPAGQQDDSHGAGRNFNGTAGHVNIGAQRHGKTGYIFPHAQRLHLFIRYGDRGGGGRCAQRGKIRRQHGAQHFQRVLAGHRPRNAELYQQYHQRDDKNQNDNFGKHRQHRRHLSGGGHIQENAENIQRKQRDNYRRDDLVNNGAEIIHGLFEGIPFYKRHAQTQHKGKNNGRRNVHKRRDGQGKIGRQFRRLRKRSQRGRHVQHPRIRQSSCAISKKTGKQRKAVRQNDRKHQQFAGVFAQLGNTWGNQPQNQQRHDKTQKLPEQAVKRQKQPHQPVRKK